MQWRPLEWGEGRVGKYDGKASYSEGVLVEWGAELGQIARMKWVETVKNGYKDKDSSEIKRKSISLKTINVFSKIVSIYCKKNVVERGPQVLLLLLAIYRAELASNKLTNISPD